jgi:hypothetical protein
MVEVSPDGGEYCRPRTALPDDPGELPALGGESPEVFRASRGEGCVEVRLHLRLLSVESTATRMD